MMQRLLSTTFARAAHSARSSSCKSRVITSEFSSQAWGVFPREREGNEYSVNWSLTTDGVTPIGDAYRNAQLKTLESKLGAKIDGGKVSVSKPTFKGGKTKVVEAGDDITHNEFNKILTLQQEHLSSGCDLFVEDHGLGAAGDYRLGARVVSDSPALAMIARNLLIKTPDYTVDHRARFNGWNHDPRWIGQPEGHFDENDSWVEVNGPGQDSQGQRPIVAFVGGPGSHAAVNFVAGKDDTDALLGATVSIGSDAPVSAMVEAMTVAASGVITSLHHNALAVPSCSVVNNKGGNVTLVVNADSSVVDSAIASGSLYSAYGNVITPDGITAMWDGAITSASSKNAATVNKFGAPHVVNDGTTAVVMQPDNMASRPSKIIFFEKDAKSGAITEEDAVSRLVDVSFANEAKTEVIKALIAGVKCSVAGSAKECL